MFVLKICMYVAYHFRGWRWQSLKCFSVLAKVKWAERQVRISCHLIFVQMSFGRPNSHPLVLLTYLLCIGCKIWISLAMCPNRFNIIFLSAAFFLQILLVPLQRYFSMGFEPSIQRWQLYPQVKFVQDVLLVSAILYIK